MEFVIDEELCAVIPPLSKEEFEQLEQNILKWGCLDPLKVWPVPNSDEIILLDGHSRFKICSEHNVSYKTKSISLIDRAAAINWMIMNQFGRSNLSAKQVSYLRGKHYEQEKQEKQKLTNPGGNNQYIEVVRHFDGQPIEQTAANAVVSKFTDRPGVKEVEDPCAIKNITETLDRLSKKFTETQIKEAVLQHFSEKKGID